MARRLVALIALTALMLCFTSCMLIWGDDRGKVGKVPESGKICATGIIAEYRGSPEIVLHDEHSWYVPK